MSLAADDEHCLHAWLTTLDTANRGSPLHAPVAGPSHAAEQLSEEEESSECSTSNDFALGVHNVDLSAIHKQVAMEEQLPQLEHFSPSIAFRAAVGHVLITCATH
jgi:hypothetical protein